jgi:hypothetical protein
VLFPLIGAGDEEEEEGGRGESLLDVDVFNVAA